MVKSCHSLKQNHLLFDDQFSIYKVHYQVLYNAIIREVYKRGKSEDINALVGSSSSEAEFIDLRQLDEFSNKHIMFAMHFNYAKIKDEDAKNCLFKDEKSLKIIFDFKNVFFLMKEPCPHLSTDQILQSKANLDQDQLDNNKIKQAAENTNQLQHNQTQSLNKKQTKNLDINENLLQLLKIFKKFNIKCQSVNILTNGVDQFIQQFPFLVEELPASGANAVQQDDQNKQLKRQQSKLKQQLQQEAASKPTKLLLPIMLYDHYDYLYDQCDITSTSTSNSNQIYAQPSSQNSWKIYLHNSEAFLFNIKEKDSLYYYNNFQINNIIFANQQVAEKYKPSELAKSQIQINTFDICLDLEDGKSVAEQKELKQKCILMKKSMLSALWANHNKKANTIIVHDIAVKESGVKCINIVKALLFENFQIFADDINQYMSNKVPRAIHKRLSLVMEQQLALHQKQSFIISQEKAQVQKKDEAEKQRCDEFADAFKQLYQDGGKVMQICETAHNTIKILLDNIVQNGQDEKYRTIKLNNKLLKQSIFQYKAGIKIIELCGFIKQSEVYITKLDANIIKLTKGDIDLGYRNFSKSILQ